MTKPTAVTKTINVTVTPTGGHGPITPVRLVANNGGCELLLLWLQRDGVSDEKFRSDAEWVQSDIQRLKTLLEGG